MPELHTLLLAACIFAGQFQIEPRWTGVDTLAQSAGLARNCQCRPDSADIPIGERAVRRELLHLTKNAGTRQTRR